MSKTMKVVLIFLLTFFCTLTACNTNKNELNIENLQQILIAEESNWSDSDNPLSDFEYQYSNELEGYTITRYIGNSKKVKIPNEIDGKPVVEIGYRSFDNQTNIKDVYIPGSVKRISSCAFYYADLEKVFISDSVEYIGKSAFSNTDLTRIVLPKSIKNIEEEAFKNCEQLAEIIVLGNLEDIDKRAFVYCESVDKLLLGQDAQMNVYSLFAINGLKTVLVDPKNEKYTSQDGVLFTKDMKGLLYYPAMKEDSVYNIPQSVEYIGHNAFVSCAKEVKIHIPDTVKEIGDFAFSANRSIQVEYEGVVYETGLEYGKEGFSNLPPEFYQAFSNK